MAKGRKAKKTAALSHVDSAGAKKQKGKHIYIFLFFYKAYVSPDEEISEKNESQMQPAIQKKSKNHLNSDSNSSN